MEMYPDLCRRLLEIILNVKIKAIHFPEREKTIETRLDGKGIRLDVYVEERGANRYFDVEMQIADSDNITAHWANRSSFLFARSTFSSKGDTFTLFATVATKTLPLR